ncbi:MAG: CoA-binding protein [Pseudomonadota bacterium]
MGDGLENEQGLIAQLDALLHPQSVAVVGVPRGMKTGKLYLMALLDQGFRGRIYPINPEAEEIEGLKAYPSVSAVPGKVDLAIILVPNNQALSVIQECAAKGVKGAVLFTAGYTETGTEEGKVLEQELVRVARSSGMRLIGPNGMGFYSPRSGLSFFPRLSREPGPVGIISHSGSLTNILGLTASQKGVRFSKVISLGNECDLGFGDFLTYLGRDQETGLIGCYIEGIKNGPSFLRALRGASLRKPVIVWKVGMTLEGSRAAASHTGALAGAGDIWGGVARQGGAVTVIGFGAWVDALMGFSMLPSYLGDRIGIVTGMGGLAVSAAEACGSEGLRLAALSDETRSSLAKFVPPTGTSLHNPIDAGLSAYLDVELYIQSARTLARDPGVDAVMVLGIGATPEANRHYSDSIIQIYQEYKKPFLMVGIPGFDPGFARKFCEAGVPFFESSERAMGTYALIRKYQLWRQQTGV